eukprot:TRINITY_DN571_c0_g1_i2.p2 TRINITY_DN571_c0_g1~~TRINITY_DN571_c0_g1_i2.p2  ORF type:complete len:179 (+),score=18.71 TRINITY_DN571_c0_g1_i2:33-539(+)
MGPPTTRTQSTHHSINRTVGNGEYYHVYRKTSFNSSDLMDVDETFSKTTWASNSTHHVPTVRPHSPDAMQSLVDRCTNSPSNWFRSLDKRKINTPADATKFVSRLLDVVGIPHQRQKLNTRGNSQYTGNRPYDYEIAIELSAFDAHIQRAQRLLKSDAPKRKKYRRRS